MSNNPPHDHFKKAIEKVQTMSDEQLQCVWTALKHYNSSENYAPGVDMDSWAQLVYGEMNHRHMLENADSVPLQETSVAASFRHKTVLPGPEQFDQYPFGGIDTSLEPD